MPQFSESGSDADDSFDSHAPNPFVNPHIASSPTRDARTILAHVLQHLTRAFVGDGGGILDDALTTVALLIAKWMYQPYALRMVITGPTGAGKTRLLHAICEMTGVPGTILPVTQVAEATWAGLQLGDATRALFPELFRDRGPSGRIIAPASVITRPCCLLIDEVDKLALVGPDSRPLDGAARAWRTGRQQSLLAALDPLSELPTRHDDVDGVVRWSLRTSMVLCAGAFGMLSHDAPMTPSLLASVGLSDELLDRMGSVVSLPQPSAEARRHLASASVDDMLDFALALDVEIEGVDELVANLPAPGAPDAPYRGVRGLRHHVERRMANSIAAAVARSESVARLTPDGPVNT